MLDRVLKRAVPRAVEGAVRPLHPLAESLWVLDRELRHFGIARLPSRSTLIRLESGGLAVISPPAPDDATREAIDSLGAVEAVVVPNPFHYLFARDFLRAYPGATLYGVPGLGARVPELDFARDLGPDAPGEWPTEIETLVVESRGNLSEALLFHEPSRSLIVTDLAFNLVRYPRRWDRLFWQASGMPAGFGPGRTSRTLLLADRKAASRALSRAARWPMERIVVAHGEVIEAEAAARFRDAFSGFGVGPHAV